MRLWSYTYVYDLRFLPYPRTLTVYGPCMHALRTHYPCITQVLTLLPRTRNPNRPGHLSFCTQKYLRTPRHDDARELSLPLYVDKTKKSLTSYSIALSH